ncbi:hypothetical protein [Caballeronia sp. dw_276]|uniref:hypothetical protein n=1 Tax=Caballeronia sp. dw_276 TaxID=2719795 RepID=UPI001BD1C41B|nr:hypothetical protein [Caballeronia sp. dw_276]
MNQKTIFRRRLVDLTVHELARLRLLNDKLLKTENWIHQRAARCLLDYQSAGGLIRARLDGHTYEDVELNAAVTCILRETNPEFESDEDNVIAKLNAKLLLDNKDVLGQENWNEVWEPGPHPLSDMHFCWLFHDLFDHHLEGDWDKMLDVGGLLVEVTLAQQRDEYWED